MFGLASGYYENYLKPPDVRILLVGLDSAGKTALLERLKVTNFASDIRRNSQSNGGKRLILAPDPSQKRAPAPQDDHDDNSNDGGDHDDNGSHCRPKHDTSSSIEPQSNGHTNPNVDVDVTMKRGRELQIKKKMCPTPSLYRKRQADGDNDEEYVYDFNGTTGITNRHKDTKTTVNNGTNGNHNFSKGQFSNGGESRTLLPRSFNKERKSPDRSVHDEVDEELGEDKRENSNKTGNQSEQHDLIPNKTMFPLHLIKPTVGMNLAKIEGAGAKVKIMDLGGTITMRPLWERYYSDVHGIAFVVDISPTSPLSKLMESRAFYRCMRDDESLVGIPILIFGNKVDLRVDGDTDVAGSTGGCDGDSDSKKGPSAVIEGGDTGGETPGPMGGIPLLEITQLFLSAPRGSTTESGGPEIEEEIALFTGSAKTGNGVRTAFEWLIKEAKVIEKVQR